MANLSAALAPEGLRQQLASLPRDARDTLFLLAVIAWVLLPQIVHTPWWTSAFAASLLLWRGQLAWRASPLPGRTVLAGLLLVAIAATWATHRTLVGRDAGVTLVVLLLALKTLELRARRDAMVVFFLGFFALLSNFFYSQSPLTALAMVAGLIGLLTALVNAHMAAGRPPLAQALRTASLLALWGAPVMLALFAFFPRMAPLWGVPSDDLAGRSGLSENMRVGEVASLALDDSVALRLRFLTPDGAAPPATALYFRGPVLAHFDGRTWQAEPLASAMESPQLHVSGEPLRYEMLIEPSKRRWLPLLDAAGDAPRLPEGSPAGRARMTGDLQWLTQRPITDVLHIGAQSHTQFQYGPLQPTRELQRYLQLPQTGNPRTRAMGRQLRSSLANPGDTRELVQKVLERLRSGGYAYTLEPGVVDTLDTADDFWFDSKQGFCEHIASAFAVLMRSMGVPARIVTGYQGGDRNSVDGYWTVRNSDAHAWAEVWIAGQGWTRVDPTGAVSPARVGRFQRLQAPRGAMTGAFADAIGNLVDTGMLQKLRAFREAADNRWNQWVINYTQSRQLHLLQRLGLQSPDWSDLLRLLGASLGALALLWLLWARLTRPRPDAWNQLLGEARARMQRSGIAAGPATSARTLAMLAQARWEPAHLPLSQALGQWLLDMEKLRYAPRSHPVPAADFSAEIAPLRRRWRQLRAMHWPPATQAPAGAPETNPPASAGLRSPAAS
jgi:transglutaminase-like putative cysteine protease